MQEEHDHIKRMAETILKRVQQSIIKKYSVLEPLITSMKWCPVKVECILETDGKTIFYQPAVICMMAKKKEWNILQKQYMHLLVHGLLFHYVDYRKYSVLTLANSVFDLEVNLFLQRLEEQECNFGIDPSKETAEMTKMYEILKKKGASELYRKAVESKQLRRVVYSESKKISMDHHENWQQYSYGKIHGHSGQSHDKAEAQKEQLCMFWMHMLQCCMKKTVLSFNDLAKQMKGKKNEYGVASIGQEAVIDKDDSPPLEYETVLREFLHEKEVCNMDPDSFDRDFYALGMEMYENVVLLEPMEETEKNGMGTIVLAIDTSGSCEGEVIRKFVAQTAGLLHTMSRLEYQELVILQADVKIWSEVHLKPGDTMPDCTQMKMYGFGGTDFRPVFRRVEELNEETQVDVLIYLTDAFGRYPLKESVVKTFFVIPNLDDQQETLKDLVPKWIECLNI